MPRISAALMWLWAGGDLSDLPRVGSSWGLVPAKVTLRGQGGWNLPPRWEVIRPTLSAFRRTSRHRQRRRPPDSEVSEEAASIVQEIDMSDPVLPAREAVTIIRSQSNGPLYLLVGLIALGAVGVLYWMATSYWYPGPTSTTTVIMSAPTAGPAATSGDGRHSLDRPASDNRPRDFTPARDCRRSPRSRSSPRTRCKTCQFHHN